MIKFFRRIRRRLLGQNKLSKYLFYAFGEIILVVLGILIALGVNNWNEDKKEIRLGKDLLARIHQDLVKDTTDFRRDINRNNELREDLKALLVNLYDGIDSVEQVQQMSNTWDQMLDQAFSPNDNTYRSMLSSGTMGSIGNPELEDQILDLYSDYEQTGALLVSISEWMISIAAEMDSQTDFIKFGSTVSDIYTTPAMLGEKDYAFLNDQQGPAFKLFVRSMSSVAFYQKVNNSYRAELMDKCHDVLIAINQELEK